jgi:hypothetical protein
MFGLYFLVNGKPQTIDRRSTDSSVTIPFERTFRNLDAGRPAEGSANLAEFNFCGCGWPDHMLIPKGNAEGLPCDLFVMVSNFAEDRVRPFSYRIISRQKFRFNNPNYFLSGRARRHLQQKVC